ncbi:MAG: class I adenylate-forming enzyme family protein [Acidimicrobiia bacterium]
MNIAAAALAAGSRDGEAFVEAASGRRWTYGELAEAAGGVSRALAGRGVGPGDRVALFGANHLEYFAGWLGIVGHGSVLTTVNLLLGGPETAAIVEHLDPDVVVAEAAHLERATAAAAGRPVVVLDEVAVPGGDELAVVPRSPDDLVAIAYTSGTTGPMPKGAVHRHAVPLAVAQGTIEALGLRPGDPTATFLPNFQLPAFACTPLVSMLLGSSCLLFDRLDVPAVLDAVVERGIAFMIAVPTALYDLVEAAERTGVRFDTLRCGPIGGAPLPPALQERAGRLGWPSANIYGSTETSGNVAVQRPGRPLRPSSCGLPAPGARLSVRDPETGEELPTGADGELWVGAERACLEYWRNPEATAEALVDGWFRTGDLAHFDEDGEVYVVDRVKDLIIRGGFNIAPVEVERMLMAHPEVAEAIVVGLPDERLGEIPVAYVVPATGASPDRAALAAYARERLGPVKAPARIDFVAGEDLPRGPLGKVRKPDLRALVRSGRLATT